MTPMEMRTDHVNRSVQRAHRMTNRVRRWGWEFAEHREANVDRRAKRVDRE
ncbi:hypothetical protein HTIA_0401 [Halorhabdus tiamatea SARL4B]|uniref:Uncharacterized protein n=1 Tax=Halorhabdus tiamatea SARL4B TaxID=1033806 RepID=S6CZ39_9EURY|nr:hypothetical protein HTIA_0401 [Halorhabdus tiamatea SARL4B]